MDLNVPELNLKQAGLVHSVKPSPAIDPGDGSVVTARFVTRVVDELVAVSFDDGTTLRGTDIHPVWLPSESRWVELRELTVGDEVQTASETRLRVTAITRQSHGKPVYNIEVHGEHVYHAGDSGVLVHNGDNYSAMLKAWDVPVPKALKNLDKKLHGHHIVMKGNWAHRPKIRAAVGASRAILKRAGIRNLNNKANLAWARNWDHGNRYAQSVLARLQEAERLAGGNKNRLKAEVTKALKEISDELAKGKKYRYPGI